MRDPQDSSEEDFELDLTREPQPPSSEIPAEILAMRARRVKVPTPSQEPSVQEVLLNPTGQAAGARPSAKTVRRLMRTQLRLGVSLLAGFFGVIVIGNLAFFFAPELAARQLGGIPLEWLFPGIVCMPLLLAAAWFYVRRATRNEDDLHHETYQAGAVG